MVLMLYCDKKETFWFTDGKSSCSPERPKNGFHSKECADILKQELDNLSTPGSSVSGSPNRYN